MARVISLPLNTSIVSSSKNSPPHPGKVQTLNPRARTKYKDRNCPAKRGQVTGCVKRVFNIQEIRRKRSLLSNR